MSLLNSLVSKEKSSRIVGDSSTGLMLVLPCFGLILFVVVAIFNLFISPKLIFSLHRSTPTNAVTLAYLLRSKVDVLLTEATHRVLN